jgi:hypothetical protein
MPRIVLDLNHAEDRDIVKGVWRLGRGYVPGEPNQGLVAELKAVDARLKDFDDSKWEEWPDVRQGLSSGFTFAWYRMQMVLPSEIRGQDVDGLRVFFETNADNYGELWIDGQIDAAAGVIIGNNVTRRVELTNDIGPGTAHTIAVLVANGPLAEPRGGVFLRYAYLAFESPN